MLDFVIKNARIDDKGSPVDIGFSAGRIAAVDAGISSDAPHYDAEGRYCSGGLIETHIHLDKSRISHRCAPAPGRMAEAVRRVSEVKPTFTPEDVYARASQTVECAIANGTTRMRTHVEFDPRVGMNSHEAIRKLVRDYAWAIDIEICAFPQEGLTNNPGTDELLVAALRDGAKVVGAAPGYDTNSSAQIHRIFDLAREFDVDIDMHLDFGNNGDTLDLDLVCELTGKYGLGGRVATGHVTKLSTLPPERQAEYARRMADAGVALTVLPATDLFLMGRDQKYDVRRGLVDAHLFCHHGCKCSLSTNNVLNPFTPFGDVSLVRMANLHANVLQLDSEDDFALCFAMISSTSADLLNLKDYGIRVGNPADVVVMDARSTSEIVTTLAQPLAVFKNGQRTVTRSRPQLHRPQ